MEYRLCIPARVDFNHEHCIFLGLASARTVILNRSMSGMPSTRGRT